MFGLSVYAQLRKLQPWKPHPLPMLKLLDGTYAQSPQAIAARWAEQLALELGSVASSFVELELFGRTRLCEATRGSLQPPSLDDVFMSLTGHVAEEIKEEVKK